MAQDYGIKTKYPTSKAEFAALIKEARKNDYHKDPLAFGIATIPRIQTGEPVRLFETVRLNEIDYLAANHRDAYGAATIINSVVDHAVPYIYVPTYEKIEEMLKLLSPFAGEPDLPNLGALTLALELQRNPTRPLMPVIIMIEDVMDFWDFPLAARLWQTIAHQADRKV